MRLWTPGRRGKRVVKVDEVNGLEVTVKKELSPTFSLKVLPLLLPRPKPKAEAAH